MEYMIFTAKECIAMHCVIGIGSSCLSSVNTGPAEKPSDYIAANIV
jgi:hypothetical protein